MTSWLIPGVYTACTALFAPTTQLTRLVWSTLAFACVERVRFGPRNTACDVEKAEVEEDRMIPRSRQEARLRGKYSSRHAGRAAEHRCSNWSDEEPSA